MNVLIVGGTSAIAQATAQLFAKTGARIFLIARNSDRLQVVANHLKVCGAQEVGVFTADLNDGMSQRASLEAAIQFMPVIDLAFLAYGELGDQRELEHSLEGTERILKINFMSYALCLTYLANHFEQQKMGTLAVVSSVAGDRGRRSNYIYGSAKAGLNAFLSGLRARLVKSQVHVLTIKPGFVDTPMTQSFQKGFLWVKPEKVAHDSYRAFLNKKNEIYTPWFWKWILLVIRWIPECLFKRISF